MAYTVLMSNLGYMRGINGSLYSHLFYAHRHFYCPPGAQKKAVGQLAALISQHKPDLCCFVEIDQSDKHTGFAQLAALSGKEYPYYDIENKYGQESPLRTMRLTRGKSNAFMSYAPVEFEKLYFIHGTKRLIYQLSLPEGITLFFAHLSLKKHVRHRQLIEIRNLIEKTGGPAIFMGDFNILTGLDELEPLLSNNNLQLVNHPDKPTFRFHQTRKLLDLCIVSEALMPRLKLDIIHQPYSDHDALLLTIR